jgi:hypothetical protein
MIAAQVGAPPLPVTLGILKAWIACEKGGNVWLWNNPLNTCWQLADSSDAGPACVQSYPTKAEGVYAIGRTLKEGRYPTLLAGLRSGSADLFFSAPGEMGTWGTNYACVRRTYGYVGPSPGPGPGPGPDPGPSPSSSAAVWLLLLGGGALAVYGARRGRPGPS